MAAYNTTDNQQGMDDDFAPTQGENTGRERSRSPVKSARAALDELHESQGGQFDTVAAMAQWLPRASVPSTMPAQLPTMQTLLQQQSPNLGGRQPPEDVMQTMIQMRMTQQAIMTEMIK
jgi:hypothetical protein